MRLRIVHLADIRHGMRAGCVEIAQAHRAQAVRLHRRAFLDAKAHARVVTLALAPEQLGRSMGTYAMAGDIGSTAGPDRAIELRGLVDAEGLRLVVRDHGPGLDLHELDHLFERFYRGRSASPQSLGTGMGLAITRGLLAAEGGRVWGENAGDGGAQFTISVPAGSHAVEVAE